MGIIAYARALFGGGNPAIAQQWTQSASLTPSQITPAPGAFPWPMVGILGQQLNHPIMPYSGAIGAPVGRWGGNQYLGPEQVPMPASSPAYTAVQTGIRNIYGPGFANVPGQSPSPATSIAPAGNPNLVTTQIALNPAFAAYINQS